MRVANLHHRHGYSRGLDDGILTDINFEIVYNEYAERYVMKCPGLPRHEREA